MLDLIRSVLEQTNQLIKLPGVILTYQPSILVAVAAVWMSSPARSSAAHRTHGSVGTDSDVVAGGGRGGLFFPHWILACPTIFLLPKCSSKNKIWGRKSPYLGEFKDKIEILTTCFNLLRRKFAAFCPWRFNPQRRWTRTYTYRRWCTETSHLRRSSCGVKALKRVQRNKLK